ncbi:MAG: hypothetical protein HY670_05650 [Chloroflexi bacterium]|nr:hypothetical protein [Chloroflexota bacterium]
MVMRRLLERDSETLARREAIAFLHNRLNPEEYVLKNINSVRDIYRQRATLKQQPGTDSIISHVAQVIINGIENGHRMRTLDCLKVLRSLSRNVRSASISYDTVEKLFLIYKKFVFSQKDEVKWCVSAIVKGRPLSDDAVEWLIQNCTHSDHILNRLLLYPTNHPKITQWAEKAYHENSVPEERRSELIALLLNIENADKFAHDNGANIMVWAIFKSRISIEGKVSLLKKYCNVEAFASIVTVADRLGSLEILSHFLDKLQRQERIL